MTRLIMLFSSFSQWLLCPLPCPPTPSLCVAFVQLVGGWVGFSFRASVHPWCLPRNFLTLAHPYSLQNAPVSFAFFCPVLELPIPQGDWLLLLEIVLETKSRAPGVTLAWLPGPPSAEHRGLGTCAQLSRFLPVATCVYTVRPALLLMSPAAPRESFRPLPRLPALLWVWAVQARCACAAGSQLEPGTHRRQVHHQSPERVHSGFALADAIISKMLRAAPLPAPSVRRSLAFPCHSLHSFLESSNLLNDFLFANITVHSLCCSFL